MCTLRNYLAYALQNVTLHRTPHNYPQLFHIAVRREFTLRQFGFKRGDLALVVRGYCAAGDA
jgi:hypothetical protein